MSRALLLSSGWRALGSLAPRSLTVPANLQPAACSAMSGERMQQLAERLSPVSASLVNSRGITTSTIRRSDEEKAAEEKAAAEAAAKAAAEKAAAEKAAAEKAAAEKAAAEKAAAEKAAAEKAAAEKAAAEKAAAEKAAAEKAAAERAAAEKAAEEAAIANMKDPIQELFLTSIRAYTQSGGLEHADSNTQAELQSELERVARQFGGTGGDMTVFPEFTFTDPTLDPINISQ